MDDAANEPLNQKDMDCLVVGGIADGVLLRNVRTDAGVIELGRPTHLKPLESSNQAQPEAAKETEVYQVYVQALPNPRNEYVQVGIAVPIDTSLWEAFGRMVVRYVQQTTREQIDHDFKTVHH